MAYQNCPLAVGGTQFLSDRQEYFLYGFFFTDRVALRVFEVNSLAPMALVGALRPVGAIDKLLTGLHDPVISHLAMLYTIAGQGLIQEAYAEAVRAGYRWHEFGDSHLILPGRRRLSAL